MASLIIPKDIAQQFRPLLGDVRYVVTSRIEEATLDRYIGFGALAFRY